MSPAPFLLPRYSMTAFRFFVTRSPSIHALARRSAAQAFVALMFGLFAFAAAAQQKGLEIDIIGGNASALPVAVVPMPYQGTSVDRADTDVAEVIRDDLNALGPVPDALRERTWSQQPIRGSEIKFPTSGACSSRTSSWSVG